MNQPIGYIEERYEISEGGYTLRAVVIHADEGELLPADGRLLKKNDYPKLYAVWGDTFGRGGLHMSRQTSYAGYHDHLVSDEFMIPDFRGRIQ